MRTNTKAVLAGDRLGDHWGTGAFWALAMIIYVQHLQICFKSAGTAEKRQVLVCHTKSMEKIMLNRHFVMLISDLFEPVEPPLCMAEYGCMACLHGYRAMCKAPPIGRLNIPHMRQQTP